jgi:DNA-binding transcriptional LysR family regulator
VPGRPSAPGDSAPERGWQNVFGDLEARAMDVAIMPAVPVPARFHASPLYDEDFVIAVRKGHPFAKHPTVERYCDMQHVLVSLTGDPSAWSTKRWPGAAARGASRSPSRASCSDSRWWRTPTSSARFRGGSSPCSDGDSA